MRGLTLKVLSEWTVCINSQILNCVLRKDWCTIICITFCFSLLLVCSNRRRRIVLTCYSSLGLLLLLIDKLEKLICQVLLLLLLLLLLLVSSCHYLTILQLLLLFVSFFNDASAIYNLWILQIIIQLIIILLLFQFKVITCISILKHMFLTRWRLSTTHIRI